MIIFGLSGEHALLSGWVVSGEGFSPVTRIAVVDSAKGVGIGYIAIDVERPDVKAVYPFAPLVSGYNAILPADLCGADPVNTLRRKFRELHRHGHEKHRDISRTAHDVHSEMAR